MSLVDVVENHTHREYRTLLYWLDDQYNVPSRSDYYLMQIACEIRRVLCKRPNSIKLKDFILNFGRKNSNSQSAVISKERKEQVTAMAKSRWAIFTRNKSNGSRNRN